VDRIGALCAHDFGPSVAELDAIEREMPVIVAEIELLGAVLDLWLSDAQLLEQWHQLDELDASFASLAPGYPSGVAG